MTGLELAAGAFVLAKLAGGSRSSGRTLEWGYYEGKPVQVELQLVGFTYDGQPLKLRHDVADAWNAMRDAAAAESVFLELNRAFATYEEQQQYRDRYLAGAGPPASPPGYSHHQLGIALDISTAGPAFAWLTAYAGNFGFKRTVAAEPWHWEFV